MTYGGLVICELRTGELVICELIVRTRTIQYEPESANLLCNQKRPIYLLVYTQYRNDFHNDSKSRKKPTQCTCYKNTTKLHVSVAEAVICTILGVPSTCMPNQRINTAQTETHSKIFPSPTYMEITKNRKGLSLFKVRERSQACEPIDGHYRSNGQQLLLWCREH